MHFKKVEEKKKKKKDEEELEDLVMMITLTREKRVINLPLPQIFAA